MMSKRGSCQCNVSMQRLEAYDEKAGEAERGRLKERGQDWQEQETEIVRAWVRAHHS